MAQNTSATPPVTTLSLPQSLPTLSVTTEQAQGIISWYNQYDGVKSISVQRSLDSVRNFVTIGILNLPKKGYGIYNDLHPEVGKNYYRLSVEFGSDLEWFSNIYKIVLDSATIAKAAAFRASNPVQTPIFPTPKNGRPELKNSNTETVPAIVTPPEFTFIPSNKIYTNPYTGHVNINLEDALNRRYNIRFYDPSKNEVLRISRVSKPILILDKNNFNSRGIYSFQLFDGTSLVEIGYVNIY